MDRGKSSVDEIVFYLCGSVPKGQSESKKLCWDENLRAKISSGLLPYSATLLDPNVRNDDLSDELATFGRDILHVSLADVVLVDGRAKRGLGVGAEMALANFLNIPVVSWCPDTSHYKRSNFSYLDQDVGDWIHPFILGLSSFVANDLTDAIGWIKEHCDASSVTTRMTLESAPKPMYDAAKHYLNGQMACDNEMLRLLQQSKTLSSRMALL